MKIFLYSEKDGWFENQGVYEFYRPAKIVKYFNNKLLINNKSITTNKPLILIEKLIKKFNGYVVGFISYNYTGNIINNFLKKDDIGLPDVYFAFFKKYKKINAKNTQKLDNIIKKIKFPDKKSYISNIFKVKKYIESGDIYQVNITHRFEIDGLFFPESIFFNLINTQPTPYLMLIKEKDFSLISGSMELFLEKRGDKIITKPIKGTRKRGDNPEEDIKLLNELKNSEKERAENLMITDLMRNDLNRIARHVNVKKLFDIEKYSSLYQMVSTVEGTLEKDISLEEIIHNTFPPGSVTGAPKKRAIEIINQLEENSRSVYCGATVFIKPNMDFVMSVAIRQSIFKNKRCYIYVGSGIVADSDPEKEYEETILKAKANLKAMGINV